MRGCLAQPAVGLFSQSACRLQANSMAGPSLLDPLSSQTETETVITDRDTLSSQTECLGCSAGGRRRQVTSADAAVRSGLLHSAGQGAQLEAGQAGQGMPRGRWFPEYVTVTARMSAARVRAQHI